VTKGEWIGQIGGARGAKCNIESREARNDFRAYKPTEIFGRPGTVMEDVVRWRGYPSQVSLADRRTTMGLRMEARDDGPGGRAARWGIN